jgi:hypothetical protein
MFNNKVMNLSKKIMLLAILAFQSNTNAESYFQGEILTIDKSISESINMEFSNESDLEPKIGEFEVLSSILMSNTVGERWATVTIKNQSSHQRLLDREHIIAIFANGEKRNPIQATHKMSGHQETTIIINFGESKFPILRVSVRN